MKIEDEFGVLWVVEANDPARTHINQLKRAGFDWVVLPRYTLTCGEISGETTAAVFLRDVRMKDCVGKISGSNERRDAAGYVPAVQEAEE